MILLSLLAACALAPQPWVDGLLAEARPQAQPDTGGTEADDDSGGDSGGDDTGGADGGSGDDTGSTTACPPEDPDNRLDDDCDGVIELSLSSAELQFTSPGETAAIGGALEVLGPAFGGTGRVLALGPGGVVSSTPSVVLVPLDASDGPVAPTAVFFSSEEGFGAALSPLPKLYGAASPGLVVSAFDYDSSGDTEGAVYLLAGPITAGGKAADLGSLVTGVKAGHLANGSITTIDLLNDSCADLIIGAPQPGAFSGGEVHILDPGCESDEPPETLSDGWAHIISGYSGSRFGAAVEKVGDIDGDGRQDLGVGAPDYGAGAVFVYTEVAAGDYTQGGPAGSTWVGASAGEQAGTALAPAGDVDGDGYDDFWVGRPGFGDGGAISLLQGAATEGSHEVDEGPATILGTIESPLGEAMSGGGDVDGDGTPDLAAPGCPSCTPGEATDGARLWLWLAPTAGTLEPDDAQVRLAIQTGEDGAGAAAWIVKDVDEDGHDELLLGAPAWSGGGASWLFRGWAAEGG